MAQYNFEGDIDNITDRQLEFINNVIVEHGFGNSKISFEAVGKAGDNYVASVKRITIEGENGNTTIIAKIAPTHEMLRLAMNSFILFRNEHIMYSEVLPKLVQLQKDAGIPEEEQLRYAKLYGSFAEQPNEVILLEDLKTSNFAMLDRFSSLSNDCVRSVLKNFAIFHSLSFVLRQKEPETYENLNGKLCDMWSALAASEETKMFFQALEDDTLSSLEDPQHINLLRHKIADTINLSVKFAKTDNNSRYTVIQQGDSWTNNIMFRFEDDKLAESIMIDYQLSKNASPVCDIMYMIFNCTDYETRRQNFHDWIDYYHLELEKSLSNFSLKANYVYPRDKLDADLKRYAKLMFGLSVVLASMVIRKTEDAAKIKESIAKENILENVTEFSVLKLDEESIMRYRQRVVGLIDSFTEFGLL